LRPPAACVDRTMSDKRWPYIAAVTSIILAIVVAYFVTRNGHSMRLR
jgi:hypothetical protein